MFAVRLFVHFSNLFILYLKILDTQLISVTYEHDTSPNPWLGEKNREANQNLSAAKEALFWETRLINISIYYKYAAISKRNHR